MSDFLTKVVTTHLGRRKLIEPRRPALFEPVDTLGVDPVFNVSSDLDETGHSDEGVLDSAGTAGDSAADAPLSQGRSPGRPAPNDYTVSVASSEPKSPLLGDSQTEQPLPASSFYRQLRQASFVPPDTGSRSWPDSGTSGSLLPREEGRPEVDVSEATTIQPASRLNRVRSPSLAEPLEPDPLTAPPEHSLRPTRQGSLQPPRSSDLQPRLPSEVENMGRLSKDVPERAPPARARQIPPGRDENTQVSSSPLRPPGHFAEPTPAPALIPATPVRLPAVEALEANRDQRSRQDDGPPTIKVTIGRLEVRAESAPAPSQPAPQATTRQRYQPKLSLTDYLKKRNEGG